VRVAISALSVKPGRTGGGETVLVNLVSALSALESGVEYILFVTEDNRHLFSEAMPSRFIYVVPTWVRSPTRRIFYELFILPLVVKRLDVDLFFAVNQIYAPWMPCPVSSLVQNLLYYHYRFSNHDYGGGSRLLREIRYRFFAALVVAVSECVKKTVIEQDGVEGENVHVVPLALSAKHSGQVAMSAIESVRDRVGGAFILHVGALMPYKNCDAILHALTLREVQELRMKLVCIGLDPWEYGHRLESLAEELELGDSVQFLPAVPHEELGAWYAAAEALLILSSCEAFSLPPFEAMAQGTPVIASNHSAVPETVGDAGVIVDPNDRRAVAGAITFVCQDREYRQALVQKGYERIGRFSWCDTASQLVRLWNVEVSGGGESD